MSSGFDAAFAKVKQLVADFRANEKFYLSTAYQEQEARHDFIDKFWLALGWDVNHETQKNPFEQEVKVERKEHGFSQRRADYAFYLAPNFRDVKFYVEAKKPHGDIATADNYFQTIRYGWSSSTPVAILHDFEQFEILDCRYRPHLETALGQSLRKYHFHDYEDSGKFAEIYWLFSREAVADGSLEKFAATLPKKRGRGVQRGLIGTADQTIDDAFLEELDQFRDELARAFKNHNPKLDGDTLTELTQRTLDRLVFLRFLEDKHIESQNRIAYFGDKGTAWQDFIAESRRLDGIYNGIVYKQHAILDAPGFKLDDEAFSGVCERLSHLNSPYDFNAIPIHILGSIYERFLGKVIVTTDKRARLEEKPEVRKAGGVYYTPEYIVRYIVENTVGKLIACKSPGQIAEMRFADIACGSGSFLLGVYDLLIRHHTKFYNENPGKAKKGDVVERDDGLHLSLQKKREILLANIYGVDIDPQAVEVAQLSLYLKLLQDETPGSARNYQLEFHETLLPTLNKNIVCGNSLIGTDILTGQLFASDEEKKLNPMDFEQRFPHIFKAGASALRETATPLDFDLPGVPLHGAFSYKKKKGAKVAPRAMPEFEGGFDAIVGNPPYIFTRETISIRERDYYSQKYALSWEKQNTFMIFMERLLKLLKPGGLGSLIVPNSWLTIESAKLLRQRYLTHVKRVVDMNYPAFHGVSMEPSIFITSGAITGQPIELARIQSSEDLSKTPYVHAERSRLQKHNLIVFHESDSVSNLVERVLASTKSLGELFDVRTGLQAYEKGKGTPPQTAEDVKRHVFDRARSENKYSIRYLEGRDIGRYSVHWSGMWMQYGPWLSQPREIGIFTRPRLLLREITAPPPYCLNFTFIEGQFLNNKSILNILDFDDVGDRLKVLVAILNSRLMSFFYKKQAVKSARTIFPKVVIKDLGHFPVPEIVVAKPHPELVMKVDQMLAAKKQLAGAQSDKDKDFYTNRCDGLDRQIDALVYDLYALTPAEIKIVEGTAA